MDVFSGATGDRIYEVVGQEDFGHLGWSLARTEDIDRDGAPDFLLGAPGSGTGGRAQLRSGASGALLWERDPLNNGSFGTVVAQIGDLDGDGIGELAIGDPSWGGGEVRIYSVQGGEALLRWQSGGLAAYGFSLAALNDLDGDGFDDLVIALPYREEGVVHVVSARPLVGQPYCGPANQNSTGGYASLSAHGSDEVEDADLILRATGLPAVRPTLWLVGDTQGFVGGVGGGQGNLCLVGTFARFSAQVRISPDSGVLIEPIDIDALPFNPPHAVQPGETWNFQAWYRDANPGLTSNLTDAVSVTFQ